MKSGIAFVIGLIVVSIIVIIIVAALALTQSPTDTSGDDVQNKGATPGTTTSGTTGGTTSGTTTSGLTYNLYKGKNSGKCLNIDLDAGNNDGAIMQIWDCDIVANADNSKFAYDPMTQEIKIKSSGKCVDVKYSGTMNGTPVWQYSCNSTPAQKWTYANNMFTNVGSGKCMNVSGDSKDNGGRIITYDCDQLAGNEIWSVV
jgi:hypothetical protein